MKCLKCESDKFDICNVRFSPTIRGEVVEVVSPSYVCGRCGERLMDSKQMNTLRKSAADQYRTKNNLLTSQEISQLRKGMGMSQAEFAQYLKVGEASIKRWETYYIQDEGNDEHIRLKSDISSAESNFLSLHWNHSADIYSGEREFSFDLFKNVILTLLKCCKSPLFLNKALFYVDFLHFKNNGISLTGMQYVRLEYGPCPDQYQSVFNFLKAKKIIAPKGKHELTAMMKVEKNIFDDKEIDTLKRVISEVRKDRGRRLYNLSHKEKGFKETPYLGVISYKYAQFLKI